MVPFQDQNSTLQWILPVPSLPKSTINLFQVVSLDAMFFLGHQPTVTQFWADSSLRAPPHKITLAPAGDMFPLGLLGRRGCHEVQCSADTCVHQGQCTHCLCDTAISDKCKNLFGRRLMNSLHYLSFLVFQVYEFFPLNSQLHAATVLLLYKRDHWVKGQLFLWQAKATLQSHCSPLHFVIHKLRMVMHSFPCEENML